MFIFRLFPNSICDSFSQKPTECIEYGIRPTTLDEEGIPWYEVALIIMFIFCLNIIMFYFIRKAIRNRINSRIDVDKNDLSGEVNSVINSYFSLKDMEKRDSEESKPTNDLGDIQTFMEEEIDDKNPGQPKNEPGSQLIMSNNISLDNPNK